MPPIVTVTNTIPQSDDDRPTITLHVLVWAWGTSTGGNNNVDETTVELVSLLSAAENVLVLLLLLGNLRGLVFHLTSAGQRTVHLTCTSQHEMEM